VEKAEDHGRTGGIRTWKTSMALLYRYNGRRREPIEDGSFWFEGITVLFSGVYRDSTVSVHAMKRLLNRSLTVTALKRILRPVTRL
jgi:hypothetical protein